MLKTNKHYGEKGNKVDRVKGMRSEGRTNFLF